MYPIAQLREPYTSIKYLAERIPVINLLKLKHPNDESKHETTSKTNQWTTYDICDGNSKLLLEYK